MKKLFESPAFALLLAVIVVIGSTLLNTKIKFGRKCAALCGEFYEQSDSVSAELRNFCSAAEKVALAAARTELSDEQADAIAAAQHDAAAAKARIDSSDFNSSARGFLKRYQKFPTPTLAGMVGLNMPCAFD